MMSDGLALLTSLAVLACSGMVGGCSKDPIDEDQKVLAQRPTSASPDLREDPISVTVGGGFNFDPGTIVHLLPNGDVTADIDGKSFNGAGRRELYERSRLLLSPLRKYATGNVSDAVFKRSARIPCAAMATDSGTAFIVWGDLDGAAEAVNVYFGCRSPEVKAISKRIDRFRSILRAEVHEGRLVETGLKAQ